ncbi:MAG: ECF transporter S component [Treponema sp.]|nr:ECF transporter S component [Treponema sp.]
MEVTSSVVSSKNKQLAITGAFSALIILMGIPGLHLGYISISPVIAFTIMHIPVLLAAFLAGLPGGLVTGLVFGLTSLVNAASSPTGVLDPFFVNPLCSVVPRMLFGTVAWALFSVLNLIPKMPKIVTAVITAFLATLCHTVLVIGSMYLFLNAKMLAAMDGKGFAVLLGVLIPGATMEAIAAVIVCTAVVGTIFVSSKRKPKIFSEKD